jgi:hypothetical protein
LTRPYVCDQTPGFAAITRLAIFTWLQIEFGLSREQVSASYCGMKQLAKLSKAAANCHTGDDLRDIFCGCIQELGYTGFDAFSMKSGTIDNADQPCNFFCKQLRLGLAKEVCEGRVAANGSGGGANILCVQTIRIDQLPENHPQECLCEMADGALHAF